jgi:hypothetical protein
MPKTKVHTYPDIATLRSLMEEYLRMLHQADSATKKLLAHDPQSEKFWDELSSHAHLITQVGDRSNTIWEEITNLIDQLPDD